MGEELKKVFLQNFLLLDFHPESMNQKHRIDFNK